MKGALNKCLKYLKILNYGFMLRLCGLGITILCFLLIGKTQVLADNGYTWIAQSPILLTPGTTDFNTNYNNNKVNYGTYSNGRVIYFLSNYAINIKCAIYKYGNNVFQYNFAIDSITYEHIDSTYYLWFSSYDNANALYYKTKSDFRLQNGMYICSWALYNSGGYNLTTSIPIYTNTDSMYSALNDGNWSGPTPPQEPEYSFNSDIGQLKDIEYRSSYNLQLNSMKYDVKCSQYTSTNIDLSQDNYGIRVQWLYYQTETQTEPNIQSDAQYFSWSDWMHNPNTFTITDGSILFNGDGGGHQFETPASTDHGGGGTWGTDGFESEKYVRADLALSPYYYDGADYYVGYTSIIKGLRPGVVGTTLIQDGDENINVNDIEVVEFDEISNDAGVIEHNIIKVISTENVYNYTYLGDDITYIINYSTNNIYTDEPIITFDWEPADANRAIKNFLSALLLFPPLLFQLFAYVPEWARNIALSVCVLIPVVGVIKLMNNRIQTS